MATWGTQDLAAALPVTDPAVAPATPATEGPNPQEYGWAKAEGYDYSTYNKSNKELADAQALFSEQAANHQPAGLHSDDWAGNGAVYEWKDEYGDVGPRFEDLEKILFGGENRQTTGIKFDNITKIEVIQEGNIRIMPARKFEDAGIHPVMMENVNFANYIVPTPIQQYCIPAVLQGHDVIACAQTGSGKTAAFLIPVLSKLMGKAKKLAAARPNPATFEAGVHGQIRAEPLVLIVCPNRELATQIFDEARRFCYRTMLRPAVVYGGGPMAEQIIQLGKGCDVLIGTPGRLIDFINRPHLLTLRRLKYMIIDEADEMLHTDWDTELKAILSGGDQEEGNITYMMFSATFPKNVRDLAKEHLKHDHVRIRVGRMGSTHENIKQDVIFVEASAKRQALYDLLMSAPPARTIIFVNSKRAADEIDDYLFNRGMPCTSIHADRTQREREDSIRAFRNGKAPILIATGVSARGIDIHNVMHVINFDLPSPQYGGIEEYTHRIGRTGRIGHQGLATSFYNDRDSDLAEALVKTLLETHQVIPDFLEQHIPEGFTADGSGDTAKLHFDADSDAGDEQNGEESGNGGAWGNNDATKAENPQPVGGWSAPASNEQPPTPVAAWGAPTLAQQPPAPVAAWVAPAPAQQPSAPVAAWGAHAPTQQLSSPVPQWGQAPSAPPTLSAANTSWSSAPQAPVSTPQWGQPSNNGNNWGSNTGGGSW